jgi:hypothetical protein
MNGAAGTAVIAAEVADDKGLLARAKDMSPMDRTSA